MDCFTEENIKYDDFHASYGAIRSIFSMISKLIYGHLLAMENWEIRGGYIPESESQTASKNMCITAVFSDWGT